MSVLCTPFFTYSRISSNRPLVNHPRKMKGDGVHWKNHEHLTVSSIMTLTTPKDFSMSEHWEIEYYGVEVPGNEILRGGLGTISFLFVVDLGCA